MATTIDSKVVEMKFDNQQFESGVSQSLSSLDKLKSALDFGNLNGSLSNISNGVSTIGNSFTSMGIIAKRVLENIADRAFSVGTRVVNSMGISQIISGWQKYAEITSATQTIMAATKQEWKDQGAQMKYVNGQLEKLNWFTDETSYSLVDMTSNIGKFTSAGIKLDQATDAMMGVASWAAISGSNVQQASRAMYNLSQAMGMGALRVQDWMSIENANMATKEFKDTAIKTAYELGVLKKSADGAYYTIGKGGKIIKVTAENFRSTLSTGWLNSKVLTKTLKKYGDFANTMHEYTEETGLSATQMLKYVEQIKRGTLRISEVTGQSVKKVKDKNGKVHEEIVKTTKATADLERIANDTGVSVDTLREGLEKLSSNYNDLGYNAFKAAQEAKTFQEAVDYSKDALSTGWMNTFKTILGDYAQSKELWTNLTSEMYDVFIEDIDNQNAVLKKWGELGGREQLIQGVEKMWKSIKLVLMTIKDAVREVFPPKTAIELWDMAHNFKEAMNDLYIKTRQFSKVLKTVLVPVLSGIKNIFEGLKTMLGSVKDAFKEVFPPATATMIQSLATSFGIFASALQGRMEIAAGTIKKVLVPVLNGLKTIATSIIRVFNSLRKAFEKVFTPGRETIIENLAKIFNKLSKIFEINEARSKQLERIFKGLFSVIDIVRQAIVAILKPFASFSSAGTDFVGIILEIIASVGDWITNLAHLIQKYNIFDNVVNGVVGVVRELMDILNKLSVSLTGMSLGDLWKTIKDNIGDALKSIGKFFGVFSSGDAKNADKVTLNIKGLIESVSKGIETLKEKWKEAKPYIDDLLKKIGETFHIKIPSWDEFSEAFRKGGAIALIAATAKTIMDFIGAILDLFYQRKKILDGFSQILDGISGCFEALQQSLQAEVLKKIADAIVEIVAALVVLSLVDANKLATATAVITAMFVELAVVLDRMTDMSDNTDVPKLLALGQGMKAIGLALAEVGVAIALVAGSKGDVVGAAAALGIMLAGMTEVINVLSKSNIDEKKVKIVAYAMKSMGFAMIEIAAAIALLANTSKDAKQTAIAAGALAAMSTVMAVFIKLLGSSNIDPAKVSAMSAAMAGIGFALIEIAAAIAIVSAAAKNPVQLATGVASLGIMLMALAVAVNMMPKNLAGIAVGLTLTAAAIMIMAGAISIVAKANPDNIVPGMEALVALLAAVTIALYGLSQSKGGIMEGAAAIAVASVGIIILANALKVLADIKDFTGVAIMGAALLVLIGAAMLAEKVTGGLFALAGAIALMGAGAALAGAGIWLVVNAIVALIGAGKEGVDVVTYALASTAKLIPLALAKLAEGIVAFVRVLIDSGSTILQGVVLLVSTILEAIKLVLPLLLETVKQIILGVLDVIISIFPKILQVIGMIIGGICELIIKYAPQIVQAIIVVTKEFLRSLREIVPDLTSTLFFILTDTLRQIRDNIEEIVKLSVEIGILIITGFIKGVTEQIPNMIETGWEFVLALINGIADGVDKHAKELHDAIVKLANALINGFCTILGIHSPSTVFENFGGNIIGGLVNGIKENAKKAWEAAKKLASDIISKIKEKFGQFKDLASTAINNMRDGFTFAATAVIEKAKEIGGKIKAKFEELVGKFKDIGSNIINALKKGLTEAKDKLVNGAKDVGDTVIGAIKKVFKIHSPSRVFMDIGRYLDEGLAIGLENYTYKVVDTTENVGKAAIRTMSDAISNIAGMVNDEMDAEPTIRPVLDLSNVTDGVGQIDSMLSANRSINLATTGGSISSSISSQQEMAMAFDSLKATLSGISSGGDTVNNNTFNITGDDPKAIADEVSRILQNKVERRDAAWA